ncbi:TPA: hypothetical protein I9Y23_000496 [Kluyvera ascorbata]|uniref:Uncharacterized protein YicS n=1 Tax=Kluyvera genomosp. 2 TaxID=2774054 RepID=A0A2T2Y528_9ENTR|nr:MULTISPECIES: YicS family protein [Enterobacteriaceae]HAT3916913.1 hypothetical protein [Kluyvera ascorbata]PSR47641.1 hypothetical protein C8256_04760 [Kluyvera genomosp. 2]BBQ81533.1 hypothetical protein WP3W18E02_00620 [Klebsiella sp. WP3-W18-ESBL-02]BBR18582.1 hypothetical protein WP3S18E05_00620 [Klebsiella sp. WP3-S18-ESBL-05]HAT3941826.1 hypothetical protein [Kluyvera ascorbata]
MKTIRIAISLAACLALPVVASPLEGLKFEQQKQQVVKDVKQNCPTHAGLSDTQFANRILDSAVNKTAVQSATRALDKNDRAAYEKAIKDIQCPTK